MSFGVNYIFKRLFFFFNRGLKFGFNWWEKIFIFNFTTFDFFKFNFKFFVFDRDFSLNQRKLMSSMRFFLFDPSIVKHSRKNYLLFLKNFSDMKHKRSVCFKGRFLINDGFIF